MRKIKQITGRSFDEYKKDTVVVFLQQFDKSGNMTEQQEPLNYCGQHWEYDSLGRMKLYDITCGESSGNGEYFYTYKNDTVLEYFSGGAWESRQYKTYNRLGQAHKSTLIRNTFSDTGDKFTSRSFLYTQYEYVYNVKKLVQIEKIKETYIHEDLESNNKPDTSSIEITNDYYYTAFDSLALTIKTKDHFKETDSIVYDPFSHYRTNEYVIYNSPDTSYIHDHLLYEYDTSGKLITKRLYLHCDKLYSTEVLAEEEEYRNGLLIKKNSFDVYR